MKLKFKQQDDNSVLIICVDDKGNEKDVGHIFTPSGSGHNNLNAIQICGLTEAFDLWGCSMYETPKTLNDEYGEKVYQQVKDIQLVFSEKTRPVKYGRRLLDDCGGCFNEPCTCERKVKHDNPYVVKREQDLLLQKKKELK